MSLFRSEEHIVNWLEGRPPGATLPVGKLAQLAHAWWSDRLDPAWLPHSRRHNQAILDDLGLVDEFWRLA
jgi:hypothetical protein